MAKQRGRGRLSDIELLPPECDQVIAWAAEELRGHKRTQTDIYEEFYAKLEELQREYRGELDFKIPSFKAFNRYSIKQATLTRRLEETRTIARAISRNFDAEASDDLTLIAAEAIKTLVFEVITAAGENGIEAKDAMNLANALRAATQAQGVSTVRRQKVEKEFEGRAREAVDKVAKAKGFSAETANTFLEMIGVKPA
ncbi:uncharacterized protein DUF3486 [Breoghania corrubedonensis]|uniref:Uncharacterized protein DUF3486 n=1 Tax=Breoghania corrubedonensis TaxID=665038 RepID=A0A2T5VCE3_9HYPH|nr:DUF3486 family protein [Breoghania corrubedonensis]PTW61416.1 uncharacterized protein DUF3486 [Breoghania corrubedonensis]